MIIGELLQAAAAEQVGALVAHMRDTELATVYPSGRDRCAHATLFGVSLGGFKDTEIGGADSVLQQLGLLGPIVGGFGYECNTGIFFGLAAIVHDCVHSQGTGHLAVGFSAHAVG